MHKKGNWKEHFLMHSKVNWKTSYYERITMKIQYIQEMIKLKHTHTFIISTETRQCKQIKKNMKTYYKKNNLILLNLFVKQK